ncbi:NACHT domain-containing protein [Streptomyces sp. NRRL B-1347]|uniref:NACHT domain-containing protein n=1 Tax=Streptomyces sp. NRRL B-1347 TaxID=1476877 RepID=UPI00068A5553|nr:NACHT domain-containing protein [Streptomyces sp. NRRL B-1347]
MEPAAVGIRLASGIVTPLVRKLFTRPGPGAALVDKPVRIDSLVSFTGEHRKLTEKDLRGLAAELVRQAVRAGERPLPADEEQAVVHALTDTLHALGDVTLTDVEAVELGHDDLARRLRRAAAAASGDPARDLSADAAYFYERLLTATCLHVLNFFTQRSTFVAHTLVRQSRRQAELVAKVDELIRRDPLPGAEDASFEQRYLEYVARKQGKLTIFGIDLANSPGKWPLDAAYMSLLATPREEVHVGDVEPGDDWQEILGKRLEQAEPHPADQALATHDRVLLRGEAGSGKTTLVQWLAVSAARQDLDERMAYLYDRVPYVLPLRTLTRHGERLPAPRDFLAAVGSPLAGEQPDGWEARVLTARRALLLVDGIDEVPDAERARTRAWLADLMDAYPGNRWLVTSRPSAVRDDWLADEGFTELTLAPMRGPDVAAFIGRWHAAATTGAPDDDAALAAYETQLLAAVRAKPDLGRLATNPLMCGLICALHRDRRGFLPLGRKDLYTAALSMLLLRRDRERHMGMPELREEPQLQVLQRLAYWLIRNGRTEMDRSRAETIIADALPAVPELAALGAAPAVYDHFLQRSGLLSEPGPDTAVFVHRTFQDFLGARAAVDEGDFGMLARHAADDQWEDVIRMAVAQARPRERAEILRDLLAHGDKLRDAPRARVHLLAAACLEHAAELDPAVRTEVERRTAELVPPRDAADARKLGAVGPMVLDLLPGPDGLTAADALNVTIAATHVPSDAAIPFLARFTSHPDQSVRGQLMWGWSRFDRRLYAEQVVARLDDGETHFTLRSDDEITELVRLGLRPRHLDIRETVGVEAASRILTACDPVVLDLRVPPGRLRPEACASLGSLTELRVLDVREPWSLALFPAEAPLRTFGLFGPRRYLRDAAAIDRWPTLNWVIAARDSYPSAPDHWQALARLPELDQLTLSTGPLATAPPELRLPTVRTLRLNHSALWESAAPRLTELFPELRLLRVMAHKVELDLSALAPHPTLSRVVVHAKRVRGLADLPTRMTVETHTSLTSPSD